MCLRHRCRSTHPGRRAARRGSALLEATVASGLLVVMLGGLWPLILAARGATAGARTQGAASRLASQRLAEIEALAHARLPGGILRDEATRLDDGQVFAPGGQGLRETGLGPLDTPTAGTSEWLDDRGGWEADGLSPGAAARYLRRWSLTTGPEGCVRVWVRVTTRTATGQAFVGGLQCPWGAAQP